MEITFASNVDLKPYNTFGISVKAKFFIAFKTTDELKAIVFSKTYRENKSLVLGGGSNILLLEDFNGLVLLNELKGINVIRSATDSIIVNAASGESWHDFVLHALDNNWGGIENMSLIPGSVGAAPMQNIGAYGKELKDVFVSLEAFHIDSGEIHSFTKEECAFGYRESVFKGRLKNKYIITAVTFELTLGEHVLNTSYGAIKAQLKEDKVEVIDIKAISNAVIKIRKSKLPNPKEIGNAGSFFKNPIIEESELSKLKSKSPNIPNYPAGTNKVKLAAGWLIEQAGWKGETCNNYGVHTKQALVLVNYGGANGKEIYALSQKIIDDVMLKYGVQLEREVNMI